MNKTIKLFLLGIAVSMSQGLFSQTQMLLNPSNSFVISKSFQVDTLGIIYWKCDSLQPGSLFTTFKPATGLGINDNMQVVRTWQDSQAYKYHTL